MEHNTHRPPTLGQTALGSFSTAGEKAFIYKVYGWMAGGLSISAVVALFVAASPTIISALVENPLIFYGLIAAEFVAVFLLSLRLGKMATTTAAAMFFGYAALNGVTLSLMFVIFTLSSISAIFLVTAGMFAGLALYGYFTKTDLTSIGNFAAMAVFGLVIAMLINLFFHNAQINMVLAGIGVILFTILTAADTQKLKWLYRHGAQADEEGQQRMALQGALALYLDFINLFIQLLQLFGSTRRN